MGALSGKPRPSNNLPASGGRFPKSSRILKSSEFRRVYDQGFRYTTRLFSAFCLDTADPARTTGPRVGFTVPRAVGKAVARNRIKRRIREAIRKELHQAGPQWDMVLNPRRAMLEAPFADIQLEVRKLINRCKPSS
jgi:ribonuclease P protein component